MQPQPPTTSLLSATDVAQILNISRSAAYRLIQDGSIPAVRIGERIVRVRLVDLDAYIVRSLTGCTTSSLLDQ